METLFKTLESPARLTFELSGDLDSKTGPGIKAALVKAIDDTKTEVCLDLANVPYIDSSGLNILLTVHKIQAERGLPMVLRNPSENVRRLFVLSNLEHYFTLEPAEA
ncbi:MAG: STAS domain-containing protein [Spirochaetes bacterium]|nr:STAS domain-containing protein [Spirochaetota bacterium]